MFAVELVVLVCVAILGFSTALDNGLGRTPQMGWNSWNHFGCNVREQTIMRAADRIVELGLKQVGYEYVNIDGNCI
jgi:hypothetical protein